MTSAETSLIGKPAAGDDVAPGMICLNPGILPCLRGIGPVVVLPFREPLERIMDLPVDLDAVAS